MTHQFDVLAAQKGADLSRCVRARIVMGNNDSSSLLRFSNFSEDLRQTNFGVAVRLARPTMLKSPHHQFCRRNRRPFAWKCLFHEQLSLDLACLRKPIWWTVILFFSPTHTSMIRQLWRSYKRLLKQTIDISGKRTIFWDHFERADFCLKNRFLALSPKLSIFRGKGRYFQITLKELSFAKKSFFGSIS